MFLITRSTGDANQIVVLHVSSRNCTSEKIYLFTIKLLLKTQQIKNNEIFTP